MRALFGLDPTALGELLPYQGVLIIVLYLRHNVSHAVCGALFGVSADISEDTFLRGRSAPARSAPLGAVAGRREPSWTPDTLDVLLVDSFETPICRPSPPDVQERFYSGKKKHHTVKSQIVTDARGEVLAVEAGHPGPTSDKALYPRSQATGQYPRAARRGNLGYQGVAEMLLPHRRRRGKAGEKTKDLTPAQKEENRWAASQRAPGEGVAHLPGRVPPGAGAVPAGGLGDGGPGPAGDGADGGIVHARQGNELHNGEY